MAYAWEQKPGDEDATRRQILALLAEKPAARLEMQRVIFDGSTFVGSYTMIHALRWLRDHGYIEPTPYSTRRYRITTAGRAALDLADMLDAAGGAA